MSIKGKKVLVTGAGGFIGSHLVERLVAEGCSVRAMLHYNSGCSLGNLELLPEDIRREIEFFHGDVTDPFSVHKAVSGRQLVFHLAALIGIPYSYVAPHSYVATNVLGTLHILEACKQLGVEKIVHTSTSEAYGTARYTPIDELHPLQGQSPYSASKISADKIAESYYCSFNLPITTIRPFNTYGPRQSVRAVIPTIISQILAGKSSIRLGSLTPVRDFNYVDDTVEGFIRIALSDCSIGEVINVGYGKGITIAALLQLICEIIGREVAVVCDDSRVRPDTSEVFELICCNQKAAALIDWTPHHSLASGIRATIAHIIANPGSYNAERYGV